MASRTQRFNTRQHMQRNTYEIFRYKDLYMKEVALHHHDFYEIYFFLSGNVRYNVESRSYLLNAGDILLINPLELHQPIFGKEQRSYERIVLWINKSFLESLSPPGNDLTACFATTAPGHTNLLRPESNLRQVLTYELDQLMQETESQDYCSEYCAISYLVQVLILLNRQAKQQNKEAEAKAASDSVVYRVVGFINSHYSENLTLDFLANQFFISKYHLSREFGRLMGTSVHRYIVQKRLIMAKQMMQEGQSSTEVYQHCGFGDYSNFYRAFKAEYQISPREFAAQLKQKEPRSEELGRRLREGMEK
ncbi:MAG: AraC family transcriptional regulator [Faecousia sp.]